MSNRFYTYSGAFLPGILARAEAETVEFTSVQQGFADLDVQGVDNGVVNAYVVTTGSGQPAGAYADGQIVEFKPLLANSGPATINVNGIGVSSIYDSNGLQLVAGALGLGWTRLFYNATYGGWELIAPTTSTVFTGVISGSAPTHKVGLTASGGSSTAAVPIDATYALDVSIVPTWTGIHTFGAEVLFNSTVEFQSSVFFNNADVIITALPGFPGLSVSGASAAATAVFQNLSSGSGNSKGILVQAGSAQTDYSQAWFNAAGTILAFLFGDGSLEVGVPTGGAQGYGTINAQGLYVNGVAVTSANSANPTGTVGLAVVNGSAATFLRSDGSPSLSQAIAPTWTGLHTFSATAGTMTINAPTTGVYGLLISNQAASSSSFGLQVKAGTNTSDFCFRLLNKGATQDYLSGMGNGEVYIVEPAAATGLSGCHQVGYLDIPLHATNTPAITDRGKKVNASGNVTIPANSAVPFPIGSSYLIENTTSGNINIAVTTDTLTWLPANSNGTRVLAAHSIMTVYKETATQWKCWGFGIS